MPTAALALATLLLTRKEDAIHTISSADGRVLSYHGPALTTRNLVGYDLHYGVDDGITMWVVVDNRAGGADYYVDKNGNLIGDLGTAFREWNNLPRKWESELVWSPMNRQFWMYRAATSDRLYYWASVSNESSEGTPISVFLFGPPTAAARKRMMLTARTLIFHRQGGEAPYENWNPRRFPFTFSGVQWDLIEPIADTGWPSGWIGDETRIYFQTRYGEDATPADAATIELEDARKQSPGSTSEFVRFVGLPFLATVTPEGLYLTTRKGKVRATTFLEGKGDAWANLASYGKLERLGSDPKGLGEFFGAGNGREWNMEITAGSARARVWTPVDFKFEGSAGTATWKAEESDGGEPFDWFLKVDTNGREFTMNNARAQTFDPKTGLPWARNYSTPIFGDNSDADRTIAYSLQQVGSQTVLHSRVAAVVTKNGKTSRTMSDYIQAGGALPTFTHLSGNSSAAYAAVQDRILRSLQMPEADGGWTPLTGIRGTRPLFFWYHPELKREFILPDCPFPEGKGDKRMYVIPPERRSVLTQHTFTDFHAERIPRFSGSAEQAAKDALGISVLKSVGYEGKNPRGYARGEDRLVIVYGGRTPWRLVWEVPKGMPAVLEGYVRIAIAPGF